MTDSTPSPSPAPAIDAGVAKAIALGLGLLLILGTALMIVLLITQKSEPSEAAFAPLQLEAGEKVTTVTSMDGLAIFLIEDANGRQRVLFLNPTTGARTDMEILASNNRVTD